jgi:hypothetical protein
MRFEILDDEGNVTNTIIATLEFVESQYPNHYREVFEPPTPVVQITKLEFLNRFTDVELAGILDASKVNSLIAVWIKKLDIAQDIRLDNEHTVNGVNALEQSGLLGVGRAAEILQT